MPDLCLTYHITQEDFVAAQRAHQRRNRAGRIQYGIGMFLFGWFIFLAAFSVVFTPKVWLNYTLPDGKQLTGTCCWLDPQTRTVLLFSPATRHALALSQEAIEAQLRAGQARMLSGTALFDVAAQRALRQLRGG